MTIKDLTVNINHLSETDFLSDWRWLIGAERLPVLVTIAGDVFLQDKGTGAVDFLDTVEGKVCEVAKSDSEFESLLNEQAFVVEHFSVRLVAPLLQEGDRPAAGQVFSFKKLPVLGGEYDRSNLEVTDISVHFSIAGQIWEQVSQLPEGTRIDSVNFDCPPGKRTKQ